MSEATNLFKFNETTGKLEYKYKDDILKDFQDTFQSIFPNINVDEATPQGQLITVLTQLSLAFISQLEDLANSFFMGGNGYFQDLWAWNLFRLTRNKGTPSSSLITITGVPNTQIPSTFKITDGNEDFIISHEVTIPEEGVIKVLFYCTKISEKIPAPNTINRIVTVVNGVDTVNNEDLTTPAISVESDQNLFQRAVYFGSTSLSANFRSILANVSQVEGIIKVEGAENFGSTPLEIKGVELPPHSIYIIAEGGTNKDIANAIFKSRATGCDMVGDVEVVISEKDIDYTFKFGRPKPKEIRAEIIVIESSSIPNNFEAVIKQNTMQFINNARIGSILTQPSLAKHLFNNLAGFDIKDVKIGLKSGSLGYAPIVLNLDENAIISSVDINVRKENA